MLVPIFGVVIDQKKKQNPKIWYAFCKYRRKKNKEI